MYQILRSEVQNIADGNPMSIELINTLPLCVKAHLLSQQKSIQETKMEEGEGGKEGINSLEMKAAAAEEEASAAAAAAADDDDEKRTFGFDEDGTPTSYISILKIEQEDESIKYESYKISMRSVLYYFLEILQQRRICEAASNNDGRSRTLVNVHDWLLMNCPAYKDRCCFQTPPLYHTISTEETSKEEEEKLSSNAVIFQWYQPDIQIGLPSIDGFVLLGSGLDDNDARLAKVTLRVSSARQVCSMFSIARRGLEKAATATTDETKEAGINEARVALLNALRRAERVLVNRDDEIDHRPAKKIVKDNDLSVNCDEITIKLLESCFNIDVGASDENERVSEWFRTCILNQ